MDVTVLANERLQLSLQEKLGTMTTHEALASSPEIAAEVDKEISEGNYMP